MPALSIDPASNPGGLSCRGNGPAAETIRSGSLCERRSAPDAGEGSAMGEADAVIAIDVDGVLAADPRRTDGEPTLRAAGYAPHQFDGLSPDGTPASGTVWLNPTHGLWLRQLLLRPAELVWATSWGPRAADWIALRLGLPDMPVLEVPDGGPRFGWSAKLDPIVRWVGDRPLAWLDDVFGGKEFGWADDRCAGHGLPTLLIEVDPSRGLQRTHIDELVTWLDTEAAHYPIEVAR